MESDALTAFILSNTLNSTLHFPAALMLNTTRHGRAFRTLTPTCIP